MYLFVGRDESQYRCNIGRNVYYFKNELCQYMWRYVSIKKEMYLNVCRCISI